MRSYPTPPTPPRCWWTRYRGARLPPCYATALAERTPVTGALLAMSVFQPATLQAPMTR